MTTEFKSLKYLNSKVSKKYQMYLLLITDGIAIQFVTFSTSCTQQNKYKEGSSSCHHYNPLCPYGIDKVRQLISVSIGMSRYLKKNFGMV